MSSKGKLPADAHFAISQFLYREAALLDAGDWDGWGRLFSADGRYWIPAAYGQTDWVNHVSLVNDNALLRGIRLQRLKIGEAPSLHGTPRSSHVISNVTVAAADEPAGRYTVYSRFVAAQHAAWENRTFHGSYLHELVTEGGELRIALKRVDLVDVDSPLGDILIPL